MKLLQSFHFLPDEPALQARVVEGVTAAGRDDILVQQQLRADRTNRVHGDFSKLVNSQPREKRETTESFEINCRHDVDTPHNGNF